VCQETLQSDLVDAEIAGKRVHRQLVPPQSLCITYVSSRTEHNPPGLTDSTALTAGLVRAGGGARAEAGEVKETLPAAEPSLRTARVLPRYLTGKESDRYDPPHDYI
jgi:hypothetical protein